MRNLTQAQFDAEYLVRPRVVRYQCYVCLAVCYKAEHVDCRDCWVPCDTVIDTVEQKWCPRCREKAEREAHNPKTGRALTWQ